MVIYIKKKINSLKNRINRSYGITQIKKNGFWFIDIPRTSSSSIKIELSKEFGVTYGKNGIFDEGYNSGFIFKPHITAQEMKDTLGEKAWNKLYTFSIVRNPWDRMVSLYHYRQRDNYLSSDVSFEEYVHKLDYEIRSNQWEWDYPPFYLGSSDFVSDKNGEIIVSKIGKFENREEDIKVIAGNIGSKNLGSLFLQKASPKGKHYSSYYTDETQKIIGDLFENDIRLFNYQFESL